MAYDWPGNVRELRHVDLPLLLLAGKPIAQQEGYLGAIQPYTLGALVDGTRDIRHQPGIYTDIWMDTGGIERKTDTFSSGI